MNTPAGRVPASVEELAATHRNFIVFLIYRISRGKVRTDDLPDLLQMIYLRIWEKQYLDRCRVLLAERGGSFNTYLYWLVRSVCCNQFRQNSKNPVSTAYRVLDPRDRPKGRVPSKLFDGVDLERQGARFGQVDLDFEQRMEQRDQLEHFAQFVSTTREGAELAATLQDLYEGLDVREIAAQRRVPRKQVTEQTKQLQALRGVYLRRAS